MNQVILSGRIGQDPITFNGGASSTLATNESYKNKQGEWVEKTAWHKITAYGNMAEKLKKKGEKCTIVGQLEYQEWEKEGVKITSAHVIVKKVI